MTTTLVANCSHSNPMYKPSSGGAFQNLDNNSSGFLPTHTWNYASTTCIYTGVVDVYSSSSVSTSSGTSSPITSSSSISFLASISAGDLLVSFMLFCWFTAWLASMIAKALSRVNTKKKYMAYSQGTEVEMIDTL